MPTLELEAIRALAPAALIVAFVGFIESISVAKAIAARENYKIDSNQELKALGFANVAAAFFSGFPVAGSFSRTAVQYQAGGRTQMASIITALMVVFVLLFLTPLFYYLPNAALAAVILVAVYGLVNLREARRIYRIRKDDGLALLVTFAVTLLVGVEQGILAGVVFALFFFIRRTAYPRVFEPNPYPHLFRVSRAAFWRGTVASDPTTRCTKRGCHGHCGYSVFLFLGRERIRRGRVGRCSPYGPAGRACERASESSHRLAPTGYR